MGFTFYLKTAFRNILNGKRQSIIFILGIFISVTIVTSLTLWSSTAENVSVFDYMNDVDYEIRVRSYLPIRLPDIKDWLDNEPLIQSTDFLHSNLAFFNAEGKNPFYRFWPYEGQDNLSDPVYMSTLLLLPNSSLERISSQFNYNGEFDLIGNDVLISKTVAERLAVIYNQTISPGFNLNLSICRQSVDFGVYLFQYEPRHFYNITIKGIYDIIPGTTMLQSLFSQDFLSNSIIFLRENMMQDDVDRMETNGLTPILVAKADSEKISENGIDNILPSLENLVERLEVAQSTSLPSILDSPFLDLKQSYGKAKIYILVLLPAVLLGLLQAIYTTNIVIERRKEEIIILKERGGQKSQIIGTLVLEFLLLALIGIVCAGVFSTFIAAVIPFLANTAPSWQNISYFLLNMKVSLIPIILTILAILVTSIMYTIYKTNQILGTEISEREKKFRGNVQKWIGIIFFLVSTLGTIVVLIVLGIIYSKQYINESNYILDNTQKASILYTLITLMLLLLTIGCTILINYLLGKSKWFYKTFLKKNGFFVRNNLHKARFKFNPILLILLIACGTTFFSFTIISSLNHNKEMTDYYNNGSDLRINTQLIDHNFSEILSNISGVDDVLPVLKSSCKYGVELVTIYGVDAIKYQTIGRWIESSFNNKYVSSLYEDADYSFWLDRLDQTRNGTIISEKLSEKYNLKLGDEITLNTIPFNGAYGTDYLQITGIIHSAPGLGLATGTNLALEQSNDYFILINDIKMIEDYGINSTKLFFGKMEANADLTSVEEEILTHNMVSDINPELVSISYAETYVYRYVPTFTSFIYAQIIMVNFIAFLVILSNINYILIQRKQDNAILFALGNSWRNLWTIIFSELTIIDIITIICSLIVSLPLALIALIITKPFLLERLILPLSFNVPFITFAIVCLILLLVPLIGVIPILSNTRIKKVAEYLHPVG